MCRIEGCEFYRAIQEFPRLYSDQNDSIQMAAVFKYMMIGRPPQKILNMSEPKVTIYMPCFNYANYVAEAIESVISQSFDSWELVVINDGSTDNTQEVLKKFEDDPRIFIIHQENKGLNVTNNIALRSANGEYIMRLDADDFLHERAIETLVDCLDKNSDVGLVFPDYYEVDAKGKILKLVKTSEISKDQYPILDRPAHGACTMFRISVLQRVGGYSEKYQRQDGYDIWLKVIRQFRPMTVDLPLFYYRQHGASITDNMPMLLETRREIVADHAQSKEKSLNTLLLIPVSDHPTFEGADPLFDLCGKPLIDHTLQELRENVGFEDVIVSTNHTKLRDYLTEKNKDLRVWNRPPELSENQGHLTEKLAKNTLQLLHEEDKIYDAVAVLPVNAPLRRFKHISWAINAMSLFESDKVVSVEECESSFFKHGADGLVGIGNSDDLRIEREALYRDTGVLYVYHREFLLGKERKERILTGHITLLPQESIRINNQYDVFLCESILEKIRREEIG